MACDEGAVSRPGVPIVTAAIAFNVSKRLQTVALALLALTTSQLIVASCTPEPAPYAVRVLVER